MKISNNIVFHKTEIPLDKYKLCYVSDNVAYFTPLELKDQWGDDWDDAPYDCNAGEPYDTRETDEIEKQDENGNIWYKAEEYEIFKLCFDRNLWNQPSDLCMDCPYSVHDINRGDIAWLRPNNIYGSANVKPIMAGVSVDEFISLMKLNNCQVYYPIENK